MGHGSNRYPKALPLCESAEMSARDFDEVAMDRDSADVDSALQLNSLALFGHKKSARNRLHKPKVLITKFEWFRMSDGGIASGYWGEDPEKVIRISQRGKHDGNDRAARSRVEVAPTENENSLSGKWLHIW